MRSKGFTIVELLIVIVVVAILAAITVVAYNGVQTRSQQSKINTDLTQLYKAILAARTAAGEVVLQGVTGSYSTGGNCVVLPDNIDLSVRNPTTEACWSSYLDNLGDISNASGIDVRGLRDPWGRPYFFDENERESGAACGGRDNIGVYARPHVKDGWTGVLTNLKPIPYITPGC